MIRFIDLFAGIGGFHVALKQQKFKSKCVFASEIDKQCISVYNQNFNINSGFDITKIEVEDIQPFNLLCAGFPCQPFSKGGSQLGFRDLVKGTLFFDILRILEFHKPEYVILENVANIVSHDRGNTYDVIHSSLSQLGYYLTHDPLILSPQDFGIPVHRKRAYILARLKKPFTENFNYDKINTNKDVIEYYNLQENKSPDLQLNDYECRLLDMWDDFRKNVIKETCGFPIWIDQFTDSPIIKTKYKWKDNFINKNRCLYNENREFIDYWMRHYRPESWITNRSHMRFEWQGGSSKSLYDCLIQFRPSGVRISRLGNFNTLVAMGHTQIIGPLHRKLSLNELKRIQGFPDDFIISESRNMAAKQLGNSVHISVLSRVLKYLIVH